MQACNHVLNQEVFCYGTDRQIHFLSKEKATDFIVSIGPGIEASILVVHYLKRMKTKNIIAKALSEEHYSLLKIIGADRIIYPEKDEALRLSIILSMRNVREYIPFSEEFILEEVLCPAHLVGKTLKELDLLKNYEILIIGIRGMEKDGGIKIPNPDTVLNKNDSLFMIGKQKDLHKLTTK